MVHGRHSSDTHLAGDDDRHRFVLLHRDGRPLGAAHRGLRARGLLHAVWHSLHRSTRTVLAGGIPSYGVFGELWRQQQTRRTLITIGLVYSILLVVVEGAYAFLAADDISRWVISEQGRIDWTSVSANFPWDGTITALVLYIPGIMAVWFAPLLAAERRMTTGKSLFYSFFGCIRNIVPVIVLVLAVMMMLTLALVAVVSIALMFTSQTLVSILTIPFIFLAATVMYASYWPMYRDLFGDLG